MYLGGSALDLGIMEEEEEEALVSLDKSAF